MREPTYRDVPYGPHERNVIDLYMVESNTPTPLYVFIHGGGFRGGDKGNIPQELLEGFRKAGISVAGINYRLSDTAPYPAAMQDSTRAVQLLRYKAEEWNLDPARVAAGGGSAGGGIAFWIGFRNDLADQDSDDPVERQSTRLTCIASWSTQSSYDPNFIRAIISGTAYAHPALQQFFRVTLDEFETPRAKRIFAEASAINYVSRDAPPVFLWYPLPNLPMTPDLDANAGIHHPKFGQVLKEKMDQLGVECILRFREDLPGLPPEEISKRFFGELVEFVRRHLC
jgi:acetyl esterase/lipase